MRRRLIGFAGALALAAALVGCGGSTQLDSANSPDTVGRSEESSAPESSTGTSSTSPSETSAPTVESSIAVVSSDAPPLVSGDDLLATALGSVQAKNSVCGTFTILVVVGLNELFSTTESIPLGLIVPTWVTLSQDAVLNPLDGQPPEVSLIVESINEGLQGLNAEMARAGLTGADFEALVVGFGSEASEPPPGVDGAKLREIAAGVDVVSVVTELEASFPEATADGGPLGSWLELSCPSIQEFIEA